jgi:hypothetical protein
MKVMMAEKTCGNQNRNDVTIDHLLGVLVFAVLAIQSFRDGWFEP